ncbi:hypothetical protein [Geobacillus sp. Y412MC52]|uniref:hypothetical protein n=1 Tax=Geobacillus sp. (strain Y412MC52) TaxID=550542 RepID=UPI00018C0C9F|nr:hypothetical protein [Geobacillus sp. Y412MC52]ADU95545.1 hypothetical protein GYMC52_3189 [Geobacillus sp. Y412MC52]
MNNKNSILTVIVVLFLFLTNSVAANSNARTEKTSSQGSGNHYSWAEEKLDKKLKELGLTKEQIDALNDETKWEIVKDKEVKKCYLLHKVAIHLMKSK